MGAATQGVALRIELPYVPQPKQAVLHSTQARQVFYGGAAGGAKSHALRWDAITFCLQNPKMDAYLFRRTKGELEDNHIRKIKDEIPTELGGYSERRERMEFYNGSGINFCYCEAEKDVTRYQGAEMHWLGVDEASHLTEYQLTYLRGRVRLGSWQPLEAQRHLLPRIVFASNPGGPGHQFLKRTFIEPSTPMAYFYDRTMANEKDPEDKGWLSIFIPSKMSDNKYLEKNYAGQFAALPPEQRKALTEGDWDVVAGAALHNLSRDRHLLRPFVPPRHWTRFMAMDWGTARPFSVGYYCVSDGALLVAKGTYPDRNLPAGSVIRYAEYYGCDGRPNHGIRLSGAQVAHEILKREEARNESPLDYRVGDYAMWSQHDGPSVKESMFRASDGRINLRQSKKDRKAGYAEVISRLAGNPDFLKSGSEWDPMFFVTANCIHFWRTVPPLVLDETDMDKGPNTNQEDHIYDEVVYALMSRPFTSTETQDDFRAQRIDPYATA